MSTLAAELDSRLQKLAPAAQAHIEALLHEALALAEATPGQPDGAWPPGYFEQTAGAFAGEPLERPAQSPVETRDRW